MKARIDDCRPLLVMASGSVAAIIRQNADDARTLRFLRKISRARLAKAKALDKFLHRKT